MFKDSSEFGDKTDKSINLGFESSLDVTNRMEKDILKFIGIIN